MSRPRGGTPADRIEVVRGAVTAADGLVLVDKPAGVTSHDVVGMTRRMAATRKVGHAGTLDPMATGLLIVGVGRATRFLTHLVGADKAYRARVRLGQETSTEDADGEVTRSQGCSLPVGATGGAHHELSAGALDAAIAALRGPIMQVPSAVSAIKVDGVRSYERARSGQEVVLPARPVVVDRLERLGAPAAALASNGTPVVDLDLVVECSSGTYVRALARDLGRALGCGAHLTALRRTAVGPLTVERACTPQALSALTEQACRAQPPRGLPTMALAEAARAFFPAVELTRQEARLVGHGQFLPCEVLSRWAQAPAGGRAHRSPERAHGADPGPRPGDGVVAAFAPDGVLVALLTRHQGRARPVLVLAPSAPAGGAPPSQEQR